MDAHPGGQTVIIGSRPASRGSVERSRQYRNAGGPAVGGGSCGAGRTLASGDGAKRRAVGAVARLQVPMIYNPPPKPPRPFEADYPHGAPADATRRLTQDIEGRPLT